MVVITQLLNLNGGYYSICEPPTLASHITSELVLVVLLPKVLQGSPILAVATAVILVDTAIGTILVLSHACCYYH